MASSLLPSLLLRLADLVLLRLADLVLLFHAGERMLQDQLIAERLLLTQRQATQWATELKGRISHEPLRHTREMEGMTAGQAANLLTHADVRHAHAALVHR